MNCQGYVRYGLTFVLAGAPSITAVKSCGPGFGGEPLPDQHPKPNIVLILSDDQCYNTIGALGHPEVKTPNLDRLAVQGTTFTHAYNMGGWNGAICVASRAMLITGSFIWEAHRYEDEYRNRERPLSRPMWGNLMQEAGYDTYFTGKWHIKRDVPDVFNHARNVRPGMPKDFPEGYNRPLSECDTLWQPWDMKWGGFWDGGTHWSEVLADDAVTFIHQASESENPFFMFLSFNAPHDPRQSPRNFTEMYPPDSLQLPENFLPEYPYKDYIGCGSNLRDERLAPFPRTPNAVRVNLQEYYAIISHMDQQIGRILNELDNSGFSENTYIFFTSDHGLAVGSHGLFGKQNMYDHSIRVPFIVAGPGIPANRKVDADIYFQDVMASSLEIAGVDKPGFVDFNSVMDIAKGAVSESHYDAIYGCYIDLQRMIRKDGHKLIVYPELKKMLLFNLEDDPHEMNDLSGDPEYDGIRESLAIDLIKLQKDMGDDLDISWITSAE